MASWKPLMTLAKCCRDFLLANAFSSRLQHAAGIKHIWQTFHSHLILSHFQWVWPVLYPLIFLGLIITAIYRLLYKSLWNIYFCTLGFLIILSIFYFNFYFILLLWKLFKIFMEMVITNLNVTNTRNPESVNWRENNSKHKQRNSALFYSVDIPQCTRGDLERWGEGDMSNWWNSGEVE